MKADQADKQPARRVLVLGATGTIGRATVRALVERGYEVVCLVRPPRVEANASRPWANDADLAGAELRIGDATDPASLARDGIRGERFDVLLSCLASRTGVPEDAWRVDHDAHVGALKQAKAAGIPHMILLSAICVQKPVLAFQKAKLTFERTLIASTLDYTIVRPTAFFKSLSGQVERVRQGKPYLVFGDGRLTACKPISDRDLGNYLADCVSDPDRRNRILPIGGPGDAITPRMQGERLFAMLDRPPRFTEVPIALLDAVIAVLTTLQHLFPALATKAELARIGRYYATESMLVLDPETGRHDAAATPETGSDTLFEHFERLVRGEAIPERGDHAVF